MSIADIQNTLMNYFATDAQKRIDAGLKDLNDIIMANYPKLDEAGRDAYGRLIAELYPEEDEE